MKTTLNPTPNLRTPLTRASCCSSKLRARTYALESAPPKRTTKGRPLRLRGCRAGAGLGLAAAPADAARGPAAYALAGDPRREAAPA
eukprot:8485016-Pyramimonas_sp.AAC.1